MTKGDEVKITDVDTNLVEITTRSGYSECYTIDEFNIRFDAKTDEFF